MRGDTASLEFDKETNSLYLRLRRWKVSSTEQLADNMAVDLDSRNNVVGLEVLLPPTMKKEVKAQLVRPSKR